MQMQLAVLPLSLLSGKSLGQLVFSSFPTVMDGDWRPALLLRAMQVCPWTMCILGQIAWIPVRYLQD